MIKLIMCLTRRADLSREEFMEYWEKNHGPFFMKNAAIMRAKRYVQSQTLSSPMNDAMKESRGLIDEFDGVAEVWFESEEDLMAGMGSEEGQELGMALLKDEQNFIDHTKTAAFLVREVEF